MKECSESLLEQGIQPLIVAVPIPVEQIRTTGQTILEGILVRQKPMGDVREVVHDYGKAESSPTGPK